jgi:hypothetical protein
MLCQRTCRAELVTDVACSASRCSAWSSDAETGLHTLLSLACLVPLRVFTALAEPAMTGMQAGKDYRFVIGYDSQLGHAGAVNTLQVTSSVARLRSRISKVIGW